MNKPQAYLVYTVGIVVFGALEITAILKGTDGYFLSIVSAGISAILGYTYKTIKLKHQEGQNAGKSKSES